MKSKGNNSNNKAGLHAIRLLEITATLLLTSREAPRSSFLRFCLFRQFY